MTYNYLLGQRTPNQQLLLQQGFEQQGKFFVLRKDMHNSLYLVVKISQTQVQADMFDSVFNKKCASFYNGHSGVALREEVRNTIAQILDAVCK